MRPFSANSLTILSHSSSAVGLRCLGGFGVDSFGLGSCLATRSSRYVPSTNFNEVGFFGGPGILWLPVFRIASKFPKTDEIAAGINLDFHAITLSSSQIDAVFQISAVIAIRVNHVSQSDGPRFAGNFSADGIFDRGFDYGGVDEISAHGVPHPQDFYGLIVADQKNFNVDVHTYAAAVVNVAVTVRVSLSSRSLLPRSEARR